jgi:hypothetical protein
LPAAEFDRLAAHLELVPLPLGEALYESGGRLGHVCFPTTAIVSLLYVLEDGASAEIAVVKLEFDRLLADILPQDPAHVLGQSGP